MAIEQMTSPPQSIIEEMVYLALKEDVGDGDLTADLIAEDEVALATVITREPCVLCGIDWFEEVYRQLDSEIFIDWPVEDSDALDANSTICTLSGSARSILTGERTALNFLQMLSATATRTSQYKSLIAGTDVIILDTRKTIPGLRVAQKYAVNCGGGQNHREGLFDAILIKENHIKACGGNLENAVEEARFKYPDTHIELEVENIDELTVALELKLDRILLDNFDIKLMKKAVKLCNKKIPLEASGGITLDNINKIAKTGVDYISTGAITKDIKAIDLSMQFL